MAIKRTPLENYVLLLDMFERMNNTKFKAKNFLKKIRPFCKTNHLSYKILYIRVRGSRTGCVIHVQEDGFLVYYDREFCEFHFYCDTSKLLLKKLLKHNLLTP